MSNRTTRPPAKASRGRSTSRRAVPRLTLNRDQIVTEALEMLDRDGLERFSLRRLADRLEVTPMALYNHVTSKQDLLQTVADTVVRQVEYGSGRGAWTTVVAACFRTLRRACLAHPGAVPLVESAKTLPESVFGPMEITLTALQGAGFEFDDALRAYSVLTTFTLGQVAYQIKGWARGVDPATAVSEGRINRSTFPSVVQVASQQTWDFDRAFEFGLTVILAGLQARVRSR